MKNKITEKEWLEDFSDFVRGGEGVKVPEDVSSQILQQIHKEMNPSAWTVFMKLLGVHGVVGTLSLAVCDQFGISPFNTGFSLANYFMKFGHSVCMTLCGFLFISLTILLGRLVLRSEEIMVLKKNVFVQIPALGALSLGAFMMLGAEVVLGIAALWLLGAAIGGFFATQLLWHSRKIYS